MGFSNDTDTSGERNPVTKRNCSKKDESRHWFLVLLGDVISQ